LLKGKQGTRAGKLPVKKISLLLKLSWSVLSIKVLFDETINPVQSLLRHPVFPALVCGPF
jgi:hypothetical protein